MKTESREFRKLGRVGRVQRLVDEGILTPDQGDQLLADVPVLPLEVAEHMIENVIGVYGLPLAVVPNVTINGKNYDIPLVIEEPSVVAALANSSKIIGLSGGYRAGTSDPIMVGQVQLVDVPDIDAAVARINASADEILATADDAVAGIVRRGGGTTGLECRILQHPEDPAPMLVVHIAINTLDAMGANAINSAVEACAPGLESLSGGQSVLKILTNLSDQRTAWAEARIDFEHLAVQDMPGDQVAWGIEQASKLAEMDPYRAATHNKGAMNGIDAVVVATGNDYRAIEAGAHAWAARSGSYSAISTWRKRDDHLWGRIELPLAVGIVGGQVKSHPWVPVLLGMLGVESASELAQVIAVAGLGQNLGALRAMASIGIQAGHMAMHARTIAISIGAPTDLVEPVAEEMRRLGKIDRATAEAVLARLTDK